MKILLIGAKKFPKSREGGVDIVIDHLADELKKQGHDVTVLVRKRRGIKVPKFYNGIRIKQIFTINRKSTDALIYSFFATLYAKFHKFDVIHFHALGNTFFLNFLKKTKKHIVVTIHGLDWKRSKFSKIGRKILLKSEEKVTKYANRIITLCESDQKHFITKYNLQTTMIPNGAKKPTFRDAKLIDANYGLQKDSYILFLARIVPEKGLHYLINAFNSIVCPSKKLVVAGGNSHSLDYYQKIVLLANNNPNIIFTGFVEGQVLDELFSNAFLYVLPSTIEGMPISLIEALSYKNICLCSDIDELLSVNSKNCHYFRSTDEKDLQEKLVDFMSNPKKEYLRENIFLDWEEVAKQTNDVYQKK